MQEAKEMCAYELHGTLTANDIYLPVLERVVIIILICATQSMGTGSNRRLFMHKRMAYYATRETQT